MQTVVPGPGAGNTQSPSGWLSGSPTTINIAGNNAHAYLDADANNAADSGGTAVSGGNFLTAASLGVSHSTVSRSLRGSALIGAETKERVRGLSTRETVE